LARHDPSSSGRFVRRVAHVVLVTISTEFANLTAPNLGEVVDQAHRGLERVRRMPHLAYSFLRRTGLSVS
jgi:hypothetical protein